MLRDERWKTWTCNLGWPVQGIYPKCTDGTFIHSVDRSHTSMKESNFADDPKTPYVLAAGNNFGQVCLYNFPCTIKNSGYVSGVGHSSHITNVRWTEKDDRVISVGGEDQCVMYWLVQKNNWLETHIITIFWYLGLLLVDIRDGVFCTILVFGSVHCKELSKFQNQMQ